MTTEKRSRSAIFTYPVLLILTALLCLVSYQVFGLNTAIGVATTSALLAHFSQKRKPDSPPAEIN